ncbi:MAG: murein biosynthesis integral membrane protein MurJ [candidate division WOR-3 bacterium]
MKGESRFTRRVGLFTFGTLLSRVMGVVREAVFAHLFGAGLATDAFNVAFRIPNFLRDLFAESALSAAFVPTFVASLRSGDQRKTWQFANNMFNTIILILTLIVLLGIFFAPQVVRVVAWGFKGEPEKLALTVTLTRIMFPLLLFVALAAWAMGILNACGSFFIPASAPVAFNVVSAVVPIVTYGFFQARGLPPILGMAYGVTFGALVQFLVQIPRLNSFGFRFQPVLVFSDPALRQVFLRWLPMILGFATWQVNFLVNTFLLTFLREGSVTWVSYAYRIQHLPSGLFGVAIGTVALAEYSHTVGNNARLDKDQFAHALNLVTVFTLPASVLLLVLSVPVVRLIYQHGRFTSFDTYQTVQALALYALGVWPAAATRNCAAGFYSLGNTKTPALVAMGVVGLNIILNLILMRYIGFRSFPLNSSICQLFNFVILFTLLARHQKGLGGRASISVFFRAFLAAILGGFFAGLFALLFERILPTPRFLLTGIEIFICGSIGLVAYYLFARLFQVKEVREALISLFRPKTLI